MLVCRVWRDCFSRVAFRTLRIVPETVNYLSERTGIPLLSNKSLRYVRSLVCYSKRVGLPSERRLRRLLHVLQRAEASLISFVAP